MNNLLLDVKNLQISFNTRMEKVNAVRGIDFTVAKGETLAIVGESGSGKSVAAMSLVRLHDEKITEYGANSQIIFDGIDILKADKKTMQNLRGGRIGMIFQEPMTSLNPYMTIGAQLSETIATHRRAITKDQTIQKIIEILQKVGINNAEKRLKSYPHEFSGGQLQRIMIAMALLNNPDLLIADEPTTALDVTIQAEILDLIHELQKDLGMAVIFITHDLGLAEHYSEKVCVMRQGQILERGNIKQVFQNPQHQYTIELLDATHKGTKTPIANSAPVLIKADNIMVDFVTERNFFGQAKKHFTAVNDISLELKQGETLGIVGESGSGKSTLGKALMQMLNYKGTVSFEQKVILPKKIPNEIRAKRQIVFQDPFGSLSPRLTIGEIIGESLLVHRPDLTKNQRKEKVVAILEEVSLSPEMINRYPHEFSGGQRQRIAIARAIISEPKFVLLDEPTSALDRSIQVKVVELLLNLQKKYQLSYIFISHDLSVIRAMSDNVLVMQKGNVVERGSAEQIFYHPQNEYTKKLINAAFDL